MAAALWTETGPIRESTAFLDRRMLSQSGGILASMMQDAGVSPADLTVCAAGLGPGSYTGLRIGLGLLQGMAAAREIPLVGVATSMTLAAGVGGCPLVYVLQESGRRTGHAAFSSYDASVFPPRERVSPRLVEPSQIPALWEGPGIVIGDAAPRVMDLCHDLTGSLVTQPESCIPRAALLARIAWHRWSSGEGGKPWDVEGIYLTVPPLPGSRWSQQCPIHGSQPGTR